MKNINSLHILVIFFALLLVSCATEAVKPSEVPQPCPQWAGEGECLITLEGGQFYADYGQVNHDPKVFDIDFFVQFTITNGGQLNVAGHNIRFLSESMEEIDIDAMKISNGTYYVHKLDEGPAWVSFKNISDENIFFSAVLLNKAE